MISSSPSLPASAPYPGKLQALVYDQTPSTGLALVYDQTPGTGLALVYDQTPSTGLALVYDQTPNTGLRHRSTWSRVPESDARSVVHDILPRTTAVTDYAIGLEKLSANGQFFVGA